MEINRTSFFFALVLVATTASTPDDGNTNIISKIQDIRNGGSQNRFARDADTPQLAVMSGSESISEGSDLVLKCTFYTSQPPQMILWNVNSNIVRKSEGRIDIETSGSTSTLTVSSMTPQDAGDYNCFDLNLPPNEDTITVEVFAATEATTATASPTTAAATTTAAAAAAAATGTSVAASNATGTATTSTSWAAEIVSADEMGMMEMVSGSETLQGSLMGLILLICTLVAAAATI